MSAIVEVLPGNNTRRESKQNINNNNNNNNNKDNKLLYKVGYARYQVSLYLGRIKVPQKHTQLPRYVTNCLNIFYLNFRSFIMIRIPEDSSNLAKY